MEITKTYMEPRQIQTVSAGRTAVERNTAGESSVQNLQKQNAGSNTVNTAGVQKTENVSSKDYTQVKSNTPEVKAAPENTAVSQKNVTVANKPESVNGKQTFSPTERRRADVEEKSVKKAQAERTKERQPVNRTNPALENLKAQKEEARTGKARDTEKENVSAYDRAMAQKAMESATDRIKSLGKHASFAYNEDISRYTITIKDAQNKEVIREIPSEEIQKMIEHLHTMKGMMMDQGI